MAHGFFSYLKNPDSVARSESEVSLGGSDLIDAKRLEDFDYAALGHIHRPQITGKDHLCYSGSPLKYSQSEIPYHKSVVVAQLGQKGHLMIRRQSLPVLDVYKRQQLWGIWGFLLAPVAVLYFLHWKEKQNWNFSFKNLF